MHLLHAPIEGTDGCPAWWDESIRVFILLPYHGRTIHFVDANGRVGSSCSQAIGDVQPDSETPNGHLFHLWLIRVQAVAFNPFRIKGPGARWKYSTGHLRRIDCVCVVAPLS